MNTKVICRFVMVLVVSVTGILQAPAAKKSQQAQQTPLTEAGQKLKSGYAEQLETLKADLAKSLPTVSDKKKTAFLTARKAEVAAEARIKVAQKRMDEIKAAKALVAHAKGKWIGGADRGIARARAKLKMATTAAERQAMQKELIRWQENRKDGENALRERQANLDKVEIERPKVEKALKAAEQTLVQAQAATMKALKDLKLKAILSNNELDTRLAKYVVLLEATPRGLAEFAQQGKEKELLIAEIMSKDDLLVQMIVADGAKGGEFGQAMDIYSRIREASDRVTEGSLRRLALAISLEHAVPVKQRNAVSEAGAPDFVDPVKRYLHFEKAFLDGELDPAFKTLSTWDYRMVVNGEEPDEILAWGREMLRNYRPDHITTPDYRWRYVAAVRSDIRYGSQDNQYDKDELQFFQNILMNGGVCGRRAFFGRFILRAFGIPTTARPQRGHAALAHWTPDGWVVCLGGGWGAGWTKTRYHKDLDFLATTQARAAGKAFMQVKRAQWFGDVMGESRVFGLLTGNPNFWYAVSLYTQKGIIEDAKAKTLAAVGEDIGEANETKEKVVIADAVPGDDDRVISIDGAGVIRIPSVATRKPTKSTAKIIFMNSYLGGKQLHYSRTGRHQEFEYTFDAPASGKFKLTARVATPSWKQSLFLRVNNKQAIAIALPHTLGLWGESDPVVIELSQGSNVLRFSRSGEVKGITIKSFILTPVPD